MNQLTEQIIVLVGFIAIFSTVEFFQKHTKGHRDHKLHLMAVLAAICCHPITLKTMENFLVHIVFFSGYVLRLH